MLLIVRMNMVGFSVVCRDLTFAWLGRFFCACYYLAFWVVISLIVNLAIPSNKAFASNAADISEIKKLYAQINRDIKDGKYKKLYLYKVFPNEKWLLQLDYTRDVKDSGDTIVVYYRNGQVAKIQSNLVIGDGDAKDESYFRENGLVFFHFSEHNDRGLDEKGRAIFAIAEERHYINVRGRLIRHLRAVYNTDKKGKKASLDHSDNNMDIDLDAKDNIDLSNIKEFELYKEIEKYIR